MPTPPSTPPAPPAHARRARVDGAAFRAVIILAAWAATAAGCYTEGGSHISLDRQVWVSRAFSPITASVIDARTGEAIWSVDVPVGQKVVFDFRGPNSNPANDPVYPDIMDWNVMPEHSQTTPLSRSVPVPSRDARRIEMTLRKAPELPERIPAVQSADSRRETGRPRPALPNDPPGTTE